ncbi:helix-turn-helix transcriptional regulator [Vibrio aestuarianus]|uniref:AlpA family phage regulatory protein n=1 Tax=Vibrio aestuarianus TaxID=28171 RepID=A0ABD7YLE2_9VIBR|nr:AlpA family phage regulatory protein [Vibrio aestuarianus]WGK85889.1 AlpA family phage regulatory protein [Vibrio aestuarianus]CAH8189825.1 Predicted transcriptional regulator (modular protein) [Vibrio aestuarianus]
MNKQQPAILIRIAEVKAMTGLSQATIYRMIKANTFPQQLDLGSGRTVAWRKHEIQDWIDTRQVRVMGGR